jgi:predicted amidohydrolase YtcJ
MTTEPRVSRRGVVSAGTAAAAAAGLTAAPALAAGKPRGAADLVLHSGRVLLMDGGHTVAEAIAIRGGKVVAAGDDREVRRLVGRGTETVNLRGRTALPGINDSHLHGIRTGLALPPYNIDVGSAAVKSIADIAQRVGAAAAAAAPGAWIRGKGWNVDKLAERRPPTRQDLDAVSPNNPVVLLDWSNHQLWVNTRALQVAGITPETQAPAGGVVVKDSAGQPTGLFYETAMGLINAKVPAFTLEEQRGALQNNISLLLSQGITSYTEPGVGAVQRGLYEQLDDAGELRVRVTALLSNADDTYPVSVDNVRAILDANRPRPSWRRGRFRINGVKLRADGVPIASRTAWMRDDYVGGGRGSLVTVGDTDEAKVAELEKMIRLVHRAGLQVGTHATGDAAIDAVVAGYAAAMRRGSRGLRHYVIHGDFTRRKALRTLARLGCGVSLNPNIKRLIADTQPAVVGADRAAYQTPYAAALDAGVVVTSASDSPNVAPNWLQGLETALLRQGVSGAVSGPDQRVALRPVLRSYTTAGAWQDGVEDSKGSLVPGMLADVCVLDGALVDRRGRLALGKGEISDLGVAMTVVGGEVAWTAEDSSQRRAAQQAAGVSWMVDPARGSMCHSC